MYLDTDVVVLQDPLAPVHVQTSYDIQVKPVCSANHVQRMP